jgi:hypothetical protein
MKIGKEIEMIPLNAQHVLINITASNINQSFEIPPSGSTVNQFRTPFSTSSQQKHPAIDFDQQERHRCFERILQQLNQSFLFEKEVVK